MRELKSLHFQENQSMVCSVSPSCRPASRLCVGMTTGTRNPMGFYSIRVRVWVDFSTRGSVNGQKVRPIGFAGTGLGT